MAEIQSEVQSLAREFENKTKEMFDRILSFLSKQNNTPSIKQQLMQQFLNYLGTHSLEDTPAVRIPDENMDIMENYLMQQKIPYIPMALHNGENMIYIPKEYHPQVIDYYRSIERLDAKYTAWTDMSVFARDSSTQGDRSLCVMDFGETTEMNDPEITELRNEFIDKMHDLGNGQTVGYSDRALITDANNNPIYSHRLAVRLPGALDSDPTTPDLVATCAEVSIDYVNGLKATTKNLSHNVDEKNLELFLNDIDTHMSGYLTDGFNSSSKSSLRYDAKTDRVLCLRPDRDFEQVLMDHSDLENLRANPEWRKKITSQLSHYTQSINNMTHCTPQEKEVLDRTPMEDLRKQEEENSMQLYEDLKAYASNTENSDVDITNTLDPNKYKTRPSFSSESFIKIVNNKIDNFEDIPIALIVSVRLNDLKDEANQIISDYVASQEQKLTDYTEEGKITTIVGDIRHDINSEDGMFKDFFKKMDEDPLLKDAKPVVKETMDALYSKIKIKPVSAVLQEEKAADNIETLVRSAKGADLSHENEVTDPTK